MNIQQTLAELTALPVDDRLRLVQLLWDSIPSDAAMTVSRDQQTELDRRVAAHETDPGSAISREELRAVSRIERNARHSVSPRGGRRFAGRC